jgi:hypothetical protein
MQLDGQFALWLAAVECPVEDFFFMKTKMSHLIFKQTVNKCQ